MEKWIYFAVIASVFITVRDYLTQDIMKKYNDKNHYIMKQYI